MITKGQQKQIPTQNPACVKKPRRNETKRGEKSAYS